MSHWSRPSTEFHPRPSNRSLYWLRNQPTPSGKLSDRLTSSELFEDTKADFKTCVSKEAEELGLMFWNYSATAAERTLARGRNGAVIGKYRDPKNPENT
jgi:hypothetical protein